MNEPKILKIVVSNTGQKIKTYRLSLNQNSNYNTLVLITQDKYDTTTCVFRQPNGKLSPKYHLVYKGLDHEDNTEDVVYEGYHRYEFPIPYAITNIAMPTATMRMDISFTMYKTNANNQQMYPTVANSQITVNRSNQNDQLDESYNTTDIENLWNTIGELHYNNIYLKQQITSINDRYDKLNQRVIELENIIGK